MVNSTKRRRHEWTAWVASLVSLMAMVSASGQAAGADAAPAREDVVADLQAGSEHATPELRRPGTIRPAPGAVADALAEGLRCSPALRDLVEDLSRYDGIVFVHQVNAAVFGRARITGATFMRVTVDGPRRYVHVAVIAGRGIDTIGTIAHELQHARELLAASVITDAEIHALYLRIGDETGNIFETAMAKEIGWRVRSEVSRCGR